MRIRLASWNVRRCIGRDGLMSIERCAAVLREIDADLVALQEFESRPGHDDDALARLATDAGCRAIAGTTMVNGDARYGNAVLTRLPVGSIHHHKLDVAGREPRAAMELHLEAAGHRLQLIVTHLGLRPAERRNQVNRLLPLFDKAGNDLVVLAGDLNEWLLWGRPLRALHRIFPGMPHRRTWPAHRPLFSLDRFWVHPRSALVKLAVHRSALARIASDHLPLIAELETDPASTVRV